MTIARKTATDRPSLAQRKAEEITELKKVTSANVDLSELEQPPEIEDGAIVETNINHKILHKTKEQDVTSDFDDDEPVVRTRPKHRSLIDFFISYWQEECETDTYFIRVDELPDFAKNPYASTSTKMWGRILFNPATFDDDIRRRTGGQGGKFRLTVCDELGAEITGTNGNSQIDIEIASVGLEQTNGNAPAQSSNTDKLLEAVLLELRESRKPVQAKSLVEQLQEMKLSTDLLKSISGVSDNPNTNPLALLSPEDQAALHMVKNPQVAAATTAALVASITRASEQINSPPEKAEGLSSLLELGERYPQLTEKAFTTFENIMGMFARIGQAVIEQKTGAVNQTDFNAPVRVNPQTELIQHTPQEDESDELVEDENTEMIEGILVAVEGEDEISLNHQIILELKAKYGDEFDEMKEMLSYMPFVALKAMCKRYVSKETHKRIFDNERTVARLKELHALVCIEYKQNKQDKAGKAGDNGKV